MGLFSSIGGALFGPVGTIGGSLIDARRGRKSAASTGNIQQDMLNRQLELAMPRDVSGEFGGITFDPETRDVSVDLDPQYSAMLDELMGRRAGYADIISKYTGDPITQAMELAKERSALREPERARERGALEARLLQQGRLGSTGGAGQQQALEESYRRQELIDEQKALADVMDIGKTYRGYEATDLASMMDIGKFPLEYSGLATAGAITPSSKFATAQTSAATAGQRAGDLGLSQLGGMIGSTFGGQGMFSDGSGGFDTTLFGDYATTFDYYNPFN